MGGNFFLPYFQSTIIAAERKTIGPLVGMAVDLYLMPSLGMAKTGYKNHAAKCQYLRSAQAGNLRILQ